MKTSDIARMIEIAKTFTGYNQDEKFTFHRLAANYLRELAKALNLPFGCYTVRSNKAGIACLGEVTLHGRDIYIQFGSSMAHHSFMYRTCNGVSDYTGGKNHWATYDSLLTHNVAEMIESIL